MNMLHKINFQPALTARKLWFLDHSLFFGMLFLLLLASGCNHTLRSALVGDMVLEDGMFLVERFGTKKSEILPIRENEKVITYNQEFIDHTDQEKEILVVNINEFVPLELAESPQTKEQNDNRKMLLLQLSEEAKEQLKTFTATHLNAHAAIVVNNKALTKHKIKTVIDGGLLQITRCTDNACEMLYTELQDNVVGKD
ncbi:MAG: hypothetical protein OEM26_00275 [Saprospiraceae bacterium]|nr:hypothetical protein [Saprospiraceae bacterium]